MNTTPTTGQPLTEESVKPLVAGDVLRVVDEADDGPIPFTHRVGDLVTVRLVDSGPFSNLRLEEDGTLWSHRRFAFVERPAQSDDHFGDVNEMIPASSVDGVVERLGYLADAMELYSQHGGNLISQENAATVYPILRTLLSSYSAQAEENERVVGLAMQAQANKNATERLLIAAREEIASLKAQLEEAVGVLEEIAKEYGQEDLTVPLHVRISKALVLRIDLAQVMLAKLRPLPTVPAEGGE